MNKVFSLSKWIWLSETKVNQYADFVTTFVLDKEDAVLRISADTNYALYLNGKFVYAGQYPDYPHYKIYDEFSVGKDCRAGENVLAVLAWSAGEDSSTYRRETAGLLFEIVSGGEVIAYARIPAIGAGRWKKSLHSWDFPFITTPRARMTGKSESSAALSPQSPWKKSAGCFRVP